MNEIIHKVKGYLGYGVTLYHKENVWKISMTDKLDEFAVQYGITGVWLELIHNNIKLKLRPLESLTKQEMVKVNNIIMYNSMGAGLKDWENAKYKDGLQMKYHLRYIEKDGYLGKNGLFDELVDYFCELHIDYQDLIGQGLAVDINK